MAFDDVTVNNLTDHDKLLRMLAEAEAQCHALVQQGACSRSACKSCLLAKRFTASYNKLSDDDKLQVDVLTRRLLSSQVTARAPAYQPEIESTILSVRRGVNSVFGFITSAAAVVGTAAMLLFAFGGR